MLAHSLLWLDVACAYNSKPLRLGSRLFCFWTGSKPAHGCLGSLPFASGGHKVFRSLTPLFCPPAKDDNGGPRRNALWNACAV
ncbi:hypothetical protein L249_2378 [Ophiocordyceps polyrhachis-furcata BCC 54312]|uniref:Uncharacterized protein n=1 Tax=Ophiocordyceps polyrhachis-furcata BCC 54312 TaxID=1330021 RepID=A0A367LPP7_9HYPO|nr:hypothetical protein L249_2378 [Ophiocordyceps polyrhachis-furcata BCC 54312]